jgi:hypothetical protein
MGCGQITTFQSQQGDGTVAQQRNGTRLNLQCQTDLPLSDVNGCRWRQHFYNSLKEVYNFNEEQNHQVKRNNTDDPRSCDIEIEKLDFDQHEGNWTCEPMLINGTSVQSRTLNVTVIGKISI